jgi:acetoacetyl-CoA synthetase
MGREAGVCRSPRAVGGPAKVVQVEDIPRAKSGKIVVLAVRNVVHGQPVKSVEAAGQPGGAGVLPQLLELAD